MSDTDKPNDPSNAAFEGARKAFDTMTDPQAFRDAQAAFGMDPSKMTDAFRTATERSMEQSKEAYARMKAATDEASRTLEATIENAHSGSLNLTKRALDGMRAQAEMNFAHLQKLSSVRSVSEFIELQTSFFRQQVDLATRQARDIQTASQSATRDVLQPSREAAERAAGKTEF
ncbi:phasin family protein [Aureimonas ureilytica]|uniref:phasin family protein n=1 Tax=Aureimonas ureilytica TaxID=401562 RepID=UPI003CF72D7C